MLCELKKSKYATSSKREGVCSMESILRGGEFLTSKRMWLGAHVSIHLRTFNHGSVEI